MMAFSDEGIRKAYRLLVGKPLGKRPLEDEDKMGKSDMLKVSCNG
jgi:hypothetical protein